MSARDDLSYIFNDALYDELYGSVPEIRVVPLFPYGVSHRRMVLYTVPNKQLWVIIIFVLLLFLMPFLLFLYHTSNMPQPMCDPEYLLFQNTSFCYKIHTTMKHFEDAEKACQDEYAHLSSIHSETENDFIVGFSRASLKDNENVDQLNVWIGLTYSKGFWQWIDGSEIDYDNWVVAERTGQWSTLSLNILNERAMKWTSHGNNHRNMFICKKLPGR